MIPRSPLPFFWQQCIAAALVASLLISAQAIVLGSAAFDEVDHAEGKQEIVQLKGLTLSLPDGSTKTVKKVETNFGEVAKHVATMLQNNHYSQKGFDEKVSAALLDNFIRFLDFKHLYFTQGDIDRFNAQYRDKLHLRILAEDLTPATEIYEVFLTRVRERVAKIRELLESEEEFLYDSSRNIDLSRKDMPFPKTMEEADQMWRDLIEADMLGEELRLEAEQRRAKEKKEEQARKAEEAKKVEEKNTSVDAGGSADSNANLAAVVPAVVTEPVTTIEPAKEVSPSEIITEGETLIIDDLKVLKVLKEAQVAQEEETAPETPQQKVLKRYELYLKDLEESSSEEDLANYFLSALASAYDPHSEYFSHSEMENFRISMKNELVGIGALLVMKEGAAEIQGLVVGGPADKGGELQAHDRIVAVGQGEEGPTVDVMFMKLQKIVEKIRGKKGSYVRLKVIPADADDPSMTKEILIQRDTVKLKDKLANAEAIDLRDPETGENTRIGWITLASFYADMEGGTTRASADVKLLLKRLVKENIEGLVLDLRSNGGGSLEEAIDLTGLFINSGPVVQSKDTAGRVRWRVSSSKKPVYDGPLVVLTDKTSASASEIVAAALQDYRRAVVVGESSTFGKGTVQTILPVRRFMPLLSDKERAGNLKVTIQKFYRIAGGSTQLQGVVPDILFPSPRDVLEIGEASLEAPLPYDEIDSLPYKVFSPEELPIDHLKVRSAARLSQSLEFQYQQLDTNRLQKRIEENLVSLNKKKRLKEVEENRLRKELREEQRKELLEKIELDEDKNGKRYQFYKLTLDNVRDENLVPVSEFSEEDSTGMRMAEDDNDDDSQSSKYPYDIDPVKAETISILRDLIGSSNSADLPVKLGGMRQSSEQG